MANPVGAPGWVDLTTREPATARAFYEGLFGWRWRMRPDYSVAMIDSTPVAGVMEPSSDDIPTAWTVYLECGSARRAVAQVRALGGQVLVPPTATPANEVFLIAVDPSGAVVGLWEAPQNAVFGRAHAGMLCWAELHTRDATAADPFYTGLLGYRQEQIGAAGGEFDYAVWYVNDLPTVGRFDTSAALPPDVPPHWEVSFQVNPDQTTDRAIERAVELGGKVVREPTDSPYGRLALLEDAVGATFCVIDTADRTGE